MDLLLSNPLVFLLYALSLVIAISFHEFAHAWTADYLGDPTPRLQGRLTLDPRKHLDPFGALFLFVAGFGWGRPVQFDPYNLRNPRRDSALISLAGPASNFVLAAVATVLLHLPILPLHSPLGNFLELFIHLNLILAVFNLVPVHPLDGFKIVGGLLSPHQAKQWYGLQQYGYLLLILLLLPLTGGTPPIWRILRPVLDFLEPIFIPGLRTI